MNTKMILSGLVLSCLSMGAFAQTTAGSVTPEMKEAFKECHQSAGKDATGKPNREAMRACLKSKGVTPPKMSPEMKEAFKECRQASGKDATTGKPEKGAMKECLQSKGLGRK